MLSFCALVGRIHRQLPFRGSRLRRLPAALVLAIFMVPAVHTTPVHAYGANQCAASRFGSDLGCTAQDVSITGIALAPGGPASCIGGSSVMVDLDVTVNFATPDRWDVGIFLANDGRDPLLLPASGGSATCSVAVLPTSSPFLDLDGVPQGTADTCGDGNGAIGGGTGTGVLRVTGVPVSCQAIGLSGGKLYIPFVVSWDNQKSPSGNLCTSIADPVPNTVSKCNAPKTTVAAEVAYGTVNTVVLPTISKSNGITTIASGDSTSYTVVITNTTGVSLSNAVFTDPAVANLTVGSVTCAAAGGATCPAATVAAMQGAGISIPTMPVNSSVTFTINAVLGGNPTGTMTNTAYVAVAGQANSASDTDTILAKITVRKQSTGSTGSFAFSGTNGVGSFSLDTSAANPQTSATYRVSAVNTQTTIAETVPAGWTLASASCTDGTSTFGTLAGDTLTIAAADVTPGRIITCTFVDERFASLMVSKSLSPAGDPGTFDLLVGGTAVASGVGNGGSGSASVPANAAVVVSETAAGTASLADYATTYSCTGGITGTGTSVMITPAPGQAISCTFVNTRKLPLLTILKSADKASANPGETIVYTVRVVNTGDGPGISVVLRDDLSPYSAFGLDTYGPGLPFSFTDSSPASGLTPGTPEYTSDKGATWLYTPTSGGGGAPAGYDGNVTGFRLPMTGTMNANGANFTIRYTVRVK
jgi:uncharacterized repeat protein (TIGR01451 family)